MEKKKVPVQSEAQQVYQPEEKKFDSKVYSQKSEPQVSV
jgi:hypothetical protein